MARLKRIIKTLIRTPKGTKDILPDDQKYWQRVEEVVEKYANLNGYLKIDTPIFEYESIFKKSIGEGTDIVEKEMFIIKNPSGENYALKADGTAPVARAYIEHGMKSWPQPVQLYYISPFFRHDQPQAGRFRQFHQAGFELIGSYDPSNDARIITIFWNIVNELGISNLTLSINSIGCKKCKKYIKIIY